MICVSNKNTHMSHFLHNEYFYFKYILLMILIAIFFLAKDKRYEY